MKPWILFKENFTKSQRTVQQVELKDMQTVTGDTLAYIEKMKKLGNKFLIGQTTGFDSLDKNNWI